MRVIQAPRKRRNSSEKNNADSPSVGKTKQGGRASNIEPDGKDNNNRFESNGRLSLTRFADKVIESPDELNPLGLRSRRKQSRSTSKSTNEVDIIHKSIELLARREHSVIELKQKLKTREYADEDIEHALTQLVRDGLVCDERFSEAYVRFRSMRGFGPSKISVELSSKGINSLLIEEYVDASSLHWLELARNAYRKKFGENAPSTYAEWTKRARFLQGRGFTSSIIQNVCPAIEWD